MTAELEKKFYDTFGIEPYTYYDCLADYKHYDQPCNRENCVSCGAYRKLLCKPNITAEKLLKMICIYNSTYTNGYTNYSLLTERNVEKLKEQILKNCLIVKDDIKPQIQQLFKENN